MKSPMLPEQHHQAVQRAMELGRGGDLGGHRRAHLVADYVRPSPVVAEPFTNPPGYTSLGATVAALTRGPGKNMFFIGPDGKPFVLVLSQAFDDRWRATVDGKSLGKPFLVDGHGMGWNIDDPGKHVVHLEFGPQTGTNVGAVITGAGLLAVGGLAVWPRRNPQVVPRREPVRRRRRMSPAVSWLAFIAGAYAMASWTGLVAAVVLAGWHWFRTPDPRVIAVAGASLVASVGVVTVVYLGVPGDFSYVVSGPLPNAIAVVGLVLVVLGGWRHRSSADDDADS